MRKFVALFAAIFAFGLVGAQQAEAQQNMVGVKGGFISSELSGDFTDVDSRTGFGFGAFLQVMVAPNFSIQPEALYLSKGASEEDGDGEVKVNYLQVPVLVQYHLPTPGVSPRLFAGPSIAFETGCDVEDNDVSASCEEDEFLNTKSADFGLVFGAGVDIPAGGVVVTLDGRYDMGVTNLSDEAEEVDFDVKNRSWEFFAGVGFPFGP